MLIRTPEQDIERILFTEKTIAARVEQLAGELTAKYGDKRPVLVCVLKGAAFFYIDLCRCMNCPIDMDFIAVSSYGLNDKSTGVVRLIKDLDNNITGRHVIIVEDIIDSGLTMKYLRQLFSARNPASITTISFLDKEDCHSGEPEDRPLWLHDPERICRRLRTRLCQLLPQPAVYRRAAAGVLSISLPESPNPPVRVWRFWLLSPIDETCISL